MKVAIIFFNIWEAGGINTITSGLVNGFQRAGHEVEYFHASPNGKMRGLEQTAVVGSRYIRLAGEQIGYHDAKQMARFSRYLEKNFDCMIFARPCPHDTKSAYGSDRKWQRLYKWVNLPKFVIFHDNLWDKYYKWLEEVSDHIQGCLYTVTNAADDSLKKFPTNQFMFLPVLLDTSQHRPDMLKKSKLAIKRNIVWLPQLKKWKGFVEFVEAVPDLKHRVDMYNIGIMYYDLNKKRKEVWTRACRKDYYAKTHPKFNGVFKNNPDGMLDFHGLVLPDRIPAILAQAGCSVDLTGMVGGDRFKGQITCAMLEPMLYGCVSVVDECMVTHKSSLLYGADDIVWTINGKENIAPRLNELMDSNSVRKMLSKRAMKYVKRFHDSRKIVERMLIPFIELGSEGYRVHSSQFIKNYKAILKGKADVG